MLRLVRPFLQIQKARFSAAASIAPNTSPEILYTGVSIIESSTQYCVLS